jgi:hypothetical protein
VYVLGLCQENMGCSGEELSAVDITEPVNAAPAKKLPEYNGFGSLKDSAQNCTSLVMHQSCTPLAKAKMSLCVCERYMH